MKNKQAKTRHQSISHAELVSASSTRVVTQGKQQRQALKIPYQVRNDYFFKGEALNKDTFRAPLRFGFTLIELLVVVLIISILAAVALPQYQKAVVRAKSRKMLTDVKIVSEALKLYQLEHGMSAESFNDLDVTVTGYSGTNCDNFYMFADKQDCISNEDNVLFWKNEVVFALWNQGKYIRSGFSYREGKDQIYCYDYETNKFCTEVLNCTRDTSMGNEKNNYFTCPAL